VVQAKKRSYHNQHPINLFLPLVIEVFGYLHKQADLFQTTMPILLELESARRPSFFYLGHFSSSKSFNHIAKDASSSILS
jgi:hypothetical protein